MKKIIFLLIVCLLPIQTFARGSGRGREICSGKKKGISHCVGTKFMCNNGTLSKSKEICGSSRFKKR